AALPRVFLSPAWAKLVNGLSEADARAIGFDIIFSYSANRFPGFEGGQYDRDFLAALARARGKVVLARSGQTTPARPFYYAVFDPAADAADRDPAVVRQAFAGKIVLIGTNLPEEDRKRTPDRFMSPPPAAEPRAGKCRLDRLGASNANGGTTPGVFVHAAAVEAVLNRNLV